MKQNDNWPGQKLLLGLNLTENAHPSCAVEGSVYVYTVVEISRIVVAIGLWWWSEEQPRNVGQFGFFKVANMNLNRRKL